MIEIDYTSGDYFTINGKQYSRIYKVDSMGTDSIKLVNIFDTRIEILSTISYSQVKVNGEIPVSITALVDSLKSIIYNKSGSFYFLPIGDYQYGTHPAFNTQWRYDDYLTGFDSTTWIDVRFWDDSNNWIQ